MLPWEEKWFKIQLNKEKQKNPASPEIAYRVYQYIIRT